MWKYILKVKVTKRAVDTFEMILPTSFYKSMSGANGKCISSSLLRLYASLYISVLDISSSSWKQKVISIHILLSVSTVKIKTQADCCSVLNTSELLLKHWANIGLYTKYGLSVNAVCSVLKMNCVAVTGDIITSRFCCCSLWTSLSCVFQCRV